MFTTTFYSFKGGVGRTLALMNVATELAKDGNNVAIIDFDLEAPGLQTFDIFPKNHKCLGILDFVKSYMDSFKKTPAVPSIKDYLFKADKKKLKCIDFAETWQLTKGTKDRQGEIWLMPAKGLKSNVRLEDIDWRDLYKKQDGFLLFEELRLKIADFTKADYLLIDSRTGFSDHSFICTNHLADALVVIFFPNEQNLVGLKEVLNSIRNQGTLDEEKIIYVGSRIPIGDDETSILSEKLDKFRAELNIGKEKKLLRLHHNSSFELIGQQLFSLKRTRHTQLFCDYVKLFDAIEILNPESRRGTMLFLLDCLSNVQKSKLHYLRSSNINSDTKQRIINGAINFYDDIFINTALAAFYNDIFINIIMDNTNHSFYHGLVAFGLSQDIPFDTWDKSDISDLPLNPFDALQIIDLFSKSDLNSSDLNTLTIGKYFELLYLSSTENFKDKKYILPFFNENLGIYLDKMVKKSLLQIESKSKDNFSRLPAHNVMIAILLNHRNDSSEYCDFSTVEVHVIQRFHGIFSKRIIDQFFRMLYNEDGIMSRFGSGQQSIIFKTTNKKVDTVDSKVSKRTDNFLEITNIFNSDFYFSSDSLIYKDVFTLIKSGNIDIESLDKLFSNTNLSDTSMSNRFFIYYLKIIIIYIKSDRKSKYSKYISGSKFDTYNQTGRCIGLVALYKMLGHKTKAVSAMSDAMFHFKNWPYFTIDGNVQPKVFSYLKFTMVEFSTFKDEIILIENSKPSEIINMFEKLLFTKKIL